MRYALSSARSLEASLARALRVRCRLEVPVVSRKLIKEVGSLWHRRVMFVWPCPSRWAPRVIQLLAYDRKGKVGAKAEGVSFSGRITQTRGGGSKDSCRGQVVYIET